MALLQCGVQGSRIAVFHGGKCTRSVGNGRQNMTRRIVSLRTMCLLISTAQKRRRSAEGTNWLQAISFRKRKTAVARNQTFKSRYESRRNIYTGCEAIYIQWLDSAVLSNYNKSFSSMQLYIHVAWNKLLETSFFRLLSASRPYTNCGRNSDAETMGPYGLSFWQQWMLNVTPCTFVDRRQNFKGTSWINIQWTGKCLRRSV
jgi:hypothetical protein